MDDELKQRILGMAVGTGVPALLPGALNTLLSSIPAIKRDAAGQGIQQGREKLLDFITNKVNTPVRIEAGSSNYAVPLPKHKGSYINIVPTASNGTLAHELGHILQANAIRKKLGATGVKFNNLIYKAGKDLNSLLGSVALIAGLTNAEDDTVRNIGLAGSAVTLPRVGEEIAASIRGAAKLKKLGLKGKLAAFYGVPSYMLGATLPMMPWLSRKMQPGLQKLLGLDPTIPATSTDTLLDNYKKYKESK